MIRLRGRPERPTLAQTLIPAVLGVVVAGCGGWLPAPIQVEQPVIPLSKVYVRNDSDAGHHVRMNWRDGFIQVSWVEAGTTQGLEGAIGTSGFPATIEVLTEDCEPVASLVGLSPGSAGIVVIEADRTTLQKLDRADASWTTTGSMQACGASLTD